eukprot:9475365-Alexandrium_andersonii.AAC.1
MSASLVGSEMCIRDRPMEAGLACAPNPKFRSMKYPYPGPPIRHPSTHPVSYTHLTLPTICSV